MTDDVILIQGRASIYSRVLEDQRSFVSLVFLILLLIIGKSVIYACILKHFTI